MSHSRPSIGKTYAALVLGEADAAQAILTPLVARVRSKRARKRLLPQGPVQLHPELVSHLHDVVLPAVENIAMQLGLAGRHCFELSVLNNAVTASLGRGVRVRGNSLDAAACCALISALCKIPVPQDVVFLGELAPEGESLLPVEHLESKLKAITEDRAFRAVICPPCEGDPALRRLLPSLAQGVESAMRDSRGAVSVRCASDIESLLRAAFPEVAIIEGALRSGYFSSTDRPMSDTTALERAATHLVAHLETRFWAVVEDSLLSANIARVKRLLRLLVQFSTCKHCYPLSAGHRLLQVLTCVPRHVLDVAAAFPLLEDRHLLAIQRYARIEDGEDLQCLRCAVTGIVPANAGVDAVRRLHAPAHLDAKRVSLASILGALSKESLARHTDIPLDEARLNYTLTEITTDSPEAVEDAVARYYLFVLRRLGLEPDVSNPHYRAEAMAVLDRAFADRGGVRGAEVEGMTGTHGGLRLVLDTVTDRLKREWTERHVRRIYEVLIKARPWRERLAIAAGLYERIKQHLAPDLQQLEPAELVEHIPKMIDRYVYLTGQLQTALRHATLRGTHDGAH